MKFSAALLFAVAAAEEKKVPPRHPLQRLARLTQFSDEILNEWFDFLPSKNSWIGKFANNADRMERNFRRNNQKCGFYDEDQHPHGGPEGAPTFGERKRREDEEWDRYDRVNPVRAVKQITTGFRKWAERYISKCSGQRMYKHQIKRMDKWNNKLQAHLASQE